MDGFWAMLFPFKIILDACQPEAGPLLIRYRLVHTKRLGIYLHHLLRSDHDRSLHDHPWTFLTLLLTGLYIEHTETGAFPRRRFSLLYRPAAWRHRLELVRPIWTLVIRFECRRTWGFWPDGKFVAWDRYFGGCCEE